MSGGSITTLLVDDHEITRIGLRKVLELVPIVTIVDEAADGKSAVEKAIELKPDLVLMDIGLPLMDGIEATSAIKSGGSSKVIIVTSHEDDEDVFAGLAAGADAYCLKDISPAQLAIAIQSVMDGAMWLDPAIARRVVQGLGSGPPEPQSPSTSAPSDSFGLSARELEVLTLVVDGATNQQIAEKLFLSAETVKSHMHNLMKKLSVSDRTQAAVKALRQGLVAQERDREADSGPGKSKRV
jgi:DNA-binding NarL/FixJ family response regulator